MSPLWVVVLLISAKIVQSHPKIFDMIKKDVEKVESTVNGLTFDLLKDFFTSSNEDPVETSGENSTEAVQGNRTKRSADDDLVKICEKYFPKPAKNELESEQIQALKREVRKLKEIVELMKDQDDMFSTIKKQESKVHEVVVDGEGKPNHEELSSIRNELNSAIRSLNQTRGLLDSERQKSSALDRELHQQKEELNKIKRIVAQNVNKFIGDSIVTSSNNSTRGSDQSQPRIKTRSSSELSEIRKLLSDLEKDEAPAAVTSSTANSNEVIESKIVQLEEKLKKKKKQRDLARELKVIEEQMQEDDNENRQLMKQLSKLVNKPQIVAPQSKGDDFDLNDLQAAIDKLKPKEDSISESQQFQIMLNKLVSGNNGGNSGININSGNHKTPQSFRPIANIRPQSIGPPPLESFGGGYGGNPSGNGYICFMTTSDGYKVAAPGFYSQPPPLPPIVDEKRGQFFPQYPPPNSGTYNYQPQAPQNSPPPAPTYNNQNPYNTFNYQEDLKNQIDTLQFAINNLNRPEYLQKPEDKEMVQNLEYQIRDLRDVVSNLNDYQNGPRSSNGTDEMRETPKKIRNKRSFEDDNKVEDDSLGTLINKMSGVLSKAMDNVEAEKKNEEFEEIQNKIDSIKNKIRGTNTTAPRSVMDDFFGSSYPSSYPSSSSYQPNSYQYQPSFKEKKIAVKTDIFTEIVAKIMDKIIAAIPVVLKKLFNFSLESLFAGDVDGYGDGYGYDHGKNELSQVFKNLGVFGLIPALILRVHNAISAFVKILKKDKFFSKFLVPVGVLGVVAGSILFLIWWLQPDDMEKYYQQDYNAGGYTDYTSPPQYQAPQPTLHTKTYSTPTNTYNNGQSPNSPIYSRSYYNSSTK